MPDGTVRRITTSFTGMPRLAAIRDAVMLLARGSKADLVVIEGYSMGGQRGSSGIGQALGELGGVVRLALYDKDIPYVDVPPSTLKKVATGNGNASKEEVLAAAIRKLGYDSHHNDEADALWLRECALMAYGVQSDGVGRMVTKDQADTLAKVAWPSLADDFDGAA